MTDENSRARNAAFVSQIFSRLLTVPPFALPALADNDQTRGPVEAYYGQIRAVPE